MGTQVLGAGGVHIIFGHTGGLTTTDNQFWTEDTTGVPDAADTGEEFGRALAGGDFDGDAWDDLAIGAPADDIETEGVADAGLVIVLRGGTSGLTTTDSQLWFQNNVGYSDPVLDDNPEPSDELGRGLEAADFNDDGFADLVIGVWREGFAPNIASAGAAHVLYGVDTIGLQADDPEQQFWNQDSTFAGEVTDVVEPDDRFGWGPV